MRSGKFLNMFMIFAVVFASLIALFICGVALRFYFTHPTVENIVEKNTECSTEHESTEVSELENKQEQEEIQEDNTEVIDDTEVSSAEPDDTVLGLSFQCISNEQHSVTVIKKDGSCVVLQDHDFVNGECKYCSYNPNAQVNFK